MKAYIHARLSAEDRALLEELRRATSRSDSEIVRRGLQLVAKLVAKNERRRPTALELAGTSVGRFRNGPRDLSTNQKRLEGFGE